MIGRLFHLVMIGGLVGSAVYAYSTKYGTIYLAEEVKKAKIKIREEKDGIAMLKAEWQHLNKPDRLQALAQRHLTLQGMELTQIARFDEIPMSTAPRDAIGAKIEMLATTPPTATPRDQTPTRSVTRTPGSRRP